MLISYDPIISKEELFIIGQYQIEGILQCENYDTLAFICDAIAKKSGDIGYDKIRTEQSSIH
jgi:hypothetical protein